MFSDGFEFKTVDDVVYEVDAANIVIQEGDVDIGANPSAEEQQEALENGGQTVINIVHSFRLQPTTFDKKSYLTYLKVRSINFHHYDRVKRKFFDSYSVLFPFYFHHVLQGYMKTVKASLQKEDESRVEIFEKNAATFAKKIVGNFKDYDFYTGESGNPDGWVQRLAM